MRSPQTSSIMKNKLKRPLLLLFSLAFWIGLWQILALTLDLGFVFPRFDDTVIAFLKLLITGHFWKTVALSLLRIFLGFLIGALLGCLLAPLTHFSELSRAVISPAMTVIKSTPVASFILVLWCLIGKNSVPTAIGVLMVTPIIWQNLDDGFKSVSAELSEVCAVYGMTPAQKFRLLVFPTLTKFLLPALVTSSALAWKSGIAAEIIVYAKNSIGKEISDAKNFFESEQMFAWTLAVILLSILIEFAIKKLGGRLGRL